MKLVFASNYLNHHQLPFCSALSKKMGDGFVFVAHTPVRQERIELGYQDLNNACPFVIRSYESDEQEQIAITKICEADVVIIGSAPLSLVRPRLKQEKLTFVYSERLYKTGYQKWKWPLRAWRYWRRYGCRKNCYLLCASAFSAADYAKTYTFINKTYKWGYFPEVKRYDDFNGLMESKKPTTILWAGRFLELKHPGHVIQVAERLKQDGYDFRINMLGNGELQESIAQMIKAKELQDRVSLLGAMTPEEVRGYMEQSQIYLFTSDRQEGWGAVLNESMNSGCAVVASDAIGAVPFLMDDQKNGLIYHSGDVDDLYQKVKCLLDHPEECKRLGTNAYTTMTDTWNAEVAAERLIHLSEKLLHGEKHPYPYTDGPCSKAEILKG